MRRANRIACALAAALLIAPVSALPAGTGATANHGGPHTVVVFAASSLTGALSAIGKAWERQSGSKVTFSFASSSTLARQIVLGAPAQIYISADVMWMNYVQSRGKIFVASRTQLLANRLALVAPRQSHIGRIDIRPGLALAAQLAGGMLAMGNPMHVPVGIYAREALKSLGVWRSVRDQVARSASDRAALALVALGECPLGIVYATDALAADAVKIVGIFPPATHKPIVYPAALTRAGKADAAAHAFFRFLTSARAARIFRDHGFRVPNE